MQRRRSLLIIISTLLAVIIIFFVSGRLSAPEADLTVDPFQNGQAVSLRGELVCLQYADQNGPVTMECAYGFRDEATGNYYALRDTTPESSLLMTAPMGEVIYIEGTYQSPADTKYLQNGTIELTAINR